MHKKKYIGGESCAKYKIKKNEKFIKMNLSLAVGHLFNKMGSELCLRHQLFKNKNKKKNFVKKDIPFAVYIHSKV